jgi:hypothetical protein
MKRNAVAQQMIPMQQARGVELATEQGEQNSPRPINPKATFERGLCPRRE